MRADVDPVTARLRIGRLLPGQYRSFVWFPGQTPRELDPIALLPAEHHDLGRIGPSPDGTLEVVLCAGDQPPPEEFSLQLFKPLGERIPLPSSSERESPTCCRTQPGSVPVGAYVLEFQAGGWAMAQSCVEIEAGTATQAGLEIHPGAKHFVQIRDDVDPQRSRVRIDLVVRDPAGQVVVRKHVRMPPGRNKTTRVDLALGEWNIEATSSNGTSGETTVVVSDLEAEPRVLPISLH
jgi:hypothetical protein